MQKYLSKRNILIIGALLLILMIFGYRHAANNIITHTAKSIAYSQQEGSDSSFKTKLKIFIKETVFVFRNQELLKKDILNNPVFAKTLALHNLKDKTNLAQQWAAGYLKKNTENITFDKVKTAQKTVHDTDYQLTYFSASTFTDALDEYGTVMYLHYYDNKLFFITGEGVLGSINLTEQTINDDQLNAHIIASNLVDFIDPNFDDYDNNIRDLFIKNNNIYVSQNIAFNPECYGTILLVGTLDTQKIEFKQIFAPDECDQTYFKKQEIQDIYIDYSISGGRIVDYKNGEILFTTGDYQKQAQGDNTHGKIFAINETTYARRIISTGHRNPQGLYYNKQENLILSTEHGVRGGDELNLNKTPEGAIENFGWPIASYSVEYDYDPETDENIFKTSHQDYGFVEPLDYYTPALGISQVIQVAENFNNIKQKQILIASLTGSNPDPTSGARGIKYLILDDNYTIMQSDAFQLDGRIRDLIYVEPLNVVIAYHEEAKSIIIIKP
ncbi:MAG: PQQ-dependent sugar dehydrogenase [Alphaproteobacteria bacterium]|nr:PQQ-dependent sugar dehydrogenase [Alphaproteobacteria bacterium]